MAEVEGHKVHLIVRREDCAVRLESSHPFSWIRLQPAEARYIARLLNREADAADGGGNN